MNLVLCSDHETASQALADRIADAVRLKPKASLLIATGNTPIRSYEFLASMGVDFSRAICFQLDEYVAVPPDDERSLYAWMMRSFVTPLGITEANVRRLDGCADDLAAVCRGHDAAIEAVGGFDLCVLGLGPNGHLGFNEPPSRPEDPSRKVVLTPESIASNAVYYQSAVPTQALTTGMAQILSAKEIVLIATGARKREILDRTLNGPVTKNLPASLLRNAKGGVTVIADESALGGAS